MKIHPLLLSICFTIITALSALGQSSPDDLGQVFKVVEEMPRFPGCEDGSGDHKTIEKCAKERMLEYIAANLEYPLEAKGVCVYQFFIEVDGTISNIKAVREARLGSAEAGIELIESFNHMPEKWRPGHQRGKPVRVQYMLPIKFPVPKTNPVKKSAKNKISGKVYDLSEVDRKPILYSCAKNNEDFETAHECSMERVQDFINDHLTYPKKAKRKKEEDEVEVQITVTEQGWISQLFARGQYKQLNEEAERVLDFMNERNIRWMPGSIDGKAVNTELFITVKFDLSE